MGLLLIYHFVLSFLKQVKHFLNTKTYWLEWLLTILVRQLGSDSLKAPYNVCAWQMFDSCVVFLSILLLPAFLS